MYLLYLLNVVVLLSFGIGVSSSPLAQGTSSKCNARDIAIVKRTANEPTYFCAWWNSDTRTRTPFMELTVSQVNNACKCISKPSKNKRAAPIDHTIVSRAQSVESCSVEMSKQFTEPWHFCKFYTAYPRTTSPFRKYSAKSLLSLCECVEGKSVTSTTKTSSTKKTSTTKTTIKSSSTKSSSSKKPTSSTSKKVTSSSKKSSLSSSSSKRLFSSSSHKTLSSSAKSPKTSSSLKPTSTSKSSTSSLHKTTSSSHMVSSTKKTSSSTQAKVSSSSVRSVSSASRSSISKSLTSTSIKPPSSTESSSKISSSSKVTTTSSSKLSSRTSDSIKSSSVSTSKSVSSSSPSVSPTSSSSSSITISSPVSPIALSTASVNASSPAAYNVSSNASTTASATASPIIAPACTLIPDLPNGGFEDGTSQTAWLARTDSFSSWAPTTAKHFEGLLSGQSTFRASTNLTQTPTRVILKNTLSDLCPGSRYSISYHSYCAVAMNEECYVRMWTSESKKGEGYFSRTSPGNDEWFSNDRDAFEFTAASSTTTLHVYVGTKTGNQIGYIYLDDFSIASSESQGIQNTVQEKISLQQ